jgi:hypothetical protein
MNFRTMIPEVNSNQLKWLMVELENIINVLIVDDSDMNLEYIDPDQLRDELKEFLK